MKKVIILLIVSISMFVFIFKNNSTSVKKIEIGDKVPSFTLKDQNGNSFTVNSSIGKPMVIYFYPKNSTPGCIKEACKFRDNFEEFTNIGALVIGISADNVASHKNFEEKYNLPFTLLADTKNKVRKLFGVPKSMLFLPGRVTYVINKKGIVIYIFNSQFASEKHIEKSLQKLKEL